MTNKQTVVERVNSWAKPGGQLLLSALVSAAVSFGSWQLQQSNLQAWSARPVVEIVLSADKNLIVHNRGTVDISDIEMYWTQYHIEAEEKQPGQIYIGDQIDGQVTGSLSPLKEFALVKTGDSATWNMKEHPSLKFYTLAEMTSRLLEASATQYAVRVVFRNAISKQKYVSYQIVSATEGGSFFNFDKGSAYGGPVAGMEKVFKIRESIRQHQARLFDDAESDRYR